jgi:hypothetical protein
MKTKNVVMTFVCLLAILMISLSQVPLPLNEQFVFAQNYYQDPCYSMYPPPWCY